jgi:diaminohydroxyphosphoribosylaminopyrimidine deaminase/5-amino-6-(5-phosphoribosylamino)uracil reductase
MSDELYMQRCFDLARRGAGRVSPNPMVGAVLVFGDKIIGEGWHRAWGGAHAEVHCINAVSVEDRPFISKSTLFCSLEPCAHVGKTPPCVDLVLQHRIPRVVVSNADPNPLVSGQSLAKLRAAGVSVVEGVLAVEGRWLNRFFFTWMGQKRPFVILKWAQSGDAFLGKTGIKTPISSPVAQRLVHRWRAETDAILVGAGTVMVDNPKLDVRLYHGKNPLRVMLDGRGRVTADRHLLDDTEPTLIFSPHVSGGNSLKTIVPTYGDAALAGVLDILSRANCASVLVEGGAQVLQQFMDQGLWDEIRVIENPQRLGSGVSAPMLPSAAELKTSFGVGPDTVSIFSRKQDCHWLGGRV